ncbi:inositol monophosphatase family protein [Sandaracinobacteroides hominis]|uniref:inositol monophosphatase family protein n=1 Tax=Sandaracinobacteroides hominis TaxID=2780086 RepID=UPI0018F33150|nr:inositol monophosphatase family protein [Sandaracinobacteroides hominis]
MTIEADIALIQRLANAADEAVKPYFRAKLEIEQKADFSPVTAADRGAERVIRDMLRSDRPTDGIYGEEYGISRGQSGRVWVIDPIDGTRGFVAGRPLYGTLIGLIEDGKPILGLISAAAAGDRWLGCTVGQPQTTLNGKRVSARACASLGAARAASTHPSVFSASGHASFQRIGRSVKDMLFGGDCHNYGLVAAGHLDLVMEENLQPYDWAALVPVVQGAGGVITDWAGQPLELGSEGRVLAAGDARVHAQAMERI